MRYIADLHIHSLFSRATSKTSHLRGLAAWAAVKGIDVVATGDFTHPGWFAQLAEELMPAGEGLYRLKPDPLFDYAALLPEGLKPARHPESIRFLLGTEISCIYKRGGRVRKVHNLVYAPNMDAARQINARLAQLGNIASDGRPILGLDSRDLLELVLMISADAFLIPAHIWTPWFSLFGSKSGFDCLEDCFGDLSPHIFALETGLSSDPDMNRLLPMLDRYTLVSNSDCHSPAKLGREANVFATELDYFSLREAIKRPRDENGRQRFLATVEFFPEEGKYHADGHRKCGVCLDPRETPRLGGICPVCRKPLTVGVLHRVLELAGRTEPRYPPGSPAVYGLVPLAELLAELLGAGPASMKVAGAYTNLINRFGSEFGLLLDTPLDELKEQGLLAEAIRRVRANQVLRQPGYDGAFGVMRVFENQELERLRGQLELFAGAGGKKPASAARRANVKACTPQLAQAAALKKRLAPAASEKNSASRLSEAQEAAVMSPAPVILVQAGPGAGKTHTLVSRVARFLAENKPCTVITFTNKAADELLARLQPEHHGACRIATFHGFFLEALRLSNPELKVLGPEECEALLARLYPQAALTERARMKSEISTFLAQDSGEEPPSCVRRYLAALEQLNMLDLDAICPQALALLRQNGAWARDLRTRVGALFVDEFQDVNAAQYGLVAELAATNQVFCIGDPDQAIYGFRGASPRWFFRFLSACQAELRTLSQNFRSGATIVSAANAVIRHNPREFSLAEPEAFCQDKGHIYVQACKNPLDEARFIAGQIEAQTGGLSHRGLEQLDATAEGAVPLSEIAVLYRNLSLASQVEQVLYERGIPFRQVDLEAWYMRGPCRLVYAWLLLLAGRDCLSQLLFLLGREKGCGQAGISHFQQVWRERGVADAPLAGLLPVLTGLAPEAFLALARAVAGLETQGQAAAVVDALMNILAPRYALNPQDDEPGRLRELALSFPDLPGFAANLERYSHSVLYDSQAEAITLASFHAAKGLEFQVVFLCACEDDILPLAPREALDDEALALHVAEERRLFYVGMTRARSSLYCSWCAERKAFSGAKREKKASPFLREFSPELVSRAPRFGASPHRQSAKQLALFPQKKS